jgi:hypothetical protein
VCDEVYREREGEEWQRMKKENEDLSQDLSRLSAEEDEAHM